MRHATALALLIALAAAPVGCQPRGAAPMDRAADKPAWRPRPVALRVYPSTRFVMQDDQPLLEARVEISDEMGDPLKAPGEFRLELYSDDTGRQLYAWRVEARTLEEQKTFYDPITRAYLMRLKLDPAAVAEGSPRLRVGFTTVEGERLHAEAPVRNATGIKP